VTGATQMGGTSHHTHGVGPATLRPRACQTHTYSSALPLLTSQPLLHLDSRPRSTDPSRVQLFHLGPLNQGKTRSIRAVLRTPRRFKDGATMSQEIESPVSIQCPAWECFGMLRWDGGERSD